MTSKKEFIDDLKENGIEFVNENGIEILKRNYVFYFNDNEILVRSGLGNVKIQFSAKKVEINNTGKIYINCSDEHSNNINLFI